MARLNVSPSSRKRTHEGAPAFSHLKPLDQLRRSVLSCLLWEREFYEDGEAIADRITKAAEQCKPGDVASLAIEARGQFNLRHAPLLLLEVLTRTGSGSRLVGDTIERVVQRADEPGEFLAICEARGMKAPSKQMKRGLARAFARFDEYQLAKYARPARYGFKRVIDLCHPRPGSEDQNALFERASRNRLALPDTWESALVGGADKRETFERLLREGRLGYLALLRNLRNMQEAGVDEGLVRNAILARKGARRVLPFRYVAAARACPQFEPALDEALQAAVEELPRLAGRTLVLVDVSHSMNDRLSGRSDLTRMDAAAALACVLNGDLRVFSFSAAGIVYFGDRPKHDVLVEVPPRRGMAGVDAVIRSQAHGGTLLGKAVREANALPHDRLVVITDEQSHDPVPDPMAKRAYMINVASNENGVGYGRWVHIDGFSEAVIQFIHELESVDC